MDFNQGICLEKCWKDQGIKKEKDEMLLRD